MSQLSLQTQGQEGPIRPQWLGGQEAEGVPRDLQSQRCSQLEAIKPLLFQGGLRSSNKHHL